MVLATCHPTRKHYAKGKCWPCYSRLWKGQTKTKDGAWATQRKKRKH